MPATLPDTAPLAELSGIVEKIEEPPQGGKEVFVGGESHYVPASQELLVRPGMKVSKGQALSNGLIDPKKLLPLTNMNTVQEFLTSEINDVMGSAAPVKSRNVEVVVKALTNITKIEDPGEHPEWLPGDIRPFSEVQHWNNTHKKDKVSHTPILKGVDVLPLEMQEDWVARLNYNRLGSTIVQASREGWTSNIHGFHPVPALAFAKEFGKKTKNWMGQY